MVAIASDLPLDIYSRKLAQTLLWTDYIGESYTESVTHNDSFSMSHECAVYQHIHWLVGHTL